MPELVQPKPFDISALSARLRDPKEYVRTSAMAELISSTTVDASMVEGVAACLNDTNRSIREVAAVALGRIGAPAVTYLIEALNERQPVSVRIAAASGLGRAGAAAAAAIPQLCRCLESSERLLRWHAGFALSKMGRSAMAALRAMLSSTDEAVLCAVITCFRWMGTEARDAIEPIKRLIASSSSPTLRLICHSAVISITGDASGVSNIVAAFQDKDAVVRQAAMEQLGELRGMANPSAASILSSLSDPVPAVRAAAALTLARIDAGGSRSVEGLTKLLQDPDTEVRANAAIALAHFGPPAAALPALEKMRTDGDARLVAIAKAAVEALSKGV